MLNTTLIALGKLMSVFFRATNLGGGSTWPGHIALNVNKNFIKQILESSATKIIVIAGTNGKTTTASLIKKALKINGKKVFVNKAGANLLNGIASSIIIKSDSRGKLNYNYAVFEIDENTLPQILDEISPDYLVLLNLFRDQLDRYGEINAISSNWKKSVKNLGATATLILNADDPQIVYLAKNSPAKKLYFHFNDLNHKSKKNEHSSDSSYCPDCGKKLSYKNITFSHLGSWECKNCHLASPKADLENFTYFPLSGIYNIYNTLASVLVLRQIGLSDMQIENSFKKFRPSFGRQEIIEYKSKKVQIFLSKNPTSFNQSLQTITELGAKTLLIILNDRIPDGRDISWIWDIDFPEIHKFKKIIISGDRVYDMALRIKYEIEARDYNSKVKTFENLAEAINSGVESLAKNETFYILPTYSAMLETRKILIGRGIL